MTRDVVKAMAEQREVPATPMTIQDAIEDALWMRRTPDAVVGTDRVKRIIETLLSALEASPCYFKASRLGLQTFTLLAYDRAGHIAMFAWADAAEEHGCRAEKVDEARRHAKEWSERPDCKWPD